jgi:hypothetical protein
MSVKQFSHILGYFAYCIYRNCNHHPDNCSYHYNHHHHHHHALKDLGFVARSRSLFNGRRVLLSPAG